MDFLEYEDQIFNKN